MNHHDIETSNPCAQITIHVSSHLNIFDQAASTQSVSTFPTRRPTDPEIRDTPPPGVALHTGTGVCIIASP